MRIDYKCPNCGSADHLKIRIMTWLTLTQDATGHHTSPVRRSNHHFYDTDEAACDECLWGGTVADLQERDEGKAQ